MPAKTDIVLVKRYGQLANRLYIYARFIAVAAEHGFSVTNLGFSEYDRYFATTEHDVFCRYPARGCFWNHRNAAVKLCRSLRKHVFSRQPCRLLGKGVMYAWRRVFCGLLARLIQLSSSIEVLDSPTRVDMDAREFASALGSKRWVFITDVDFIAPVLFEKHADEIRKYFELAEPYRGNVLALIGEIRKTCDVLIGVHIRQGDYEQFGGGSLLFPSSQYAETMRHVLGLFHGQRVKFLVCSNVKQAPGEFDGLDYRFGTGDLAEDLYSLSKCDYLIGTLSSYAHWAAFHGQVPLFVMRADAMKPSGLEEFTAPRRDWS